MILDHAKKFDLTFIQETLISKQNSIDLLSSRWKGPSFWSPAIGKQGGVAILVHENFSGKILNWRKDSDGRILSLLVDFVSFRLNIINIYAPANLTERKKFFETLHQYFLPADHTILGGDFNCYEKNLDKIGGNVTIADYLTDFRLNFKFLDIWRKRNARNRLMTWFNSDFSIGSRLDKFFISKNLENFVDKCEILPCCLSDHDYVNLVFDFSDLTPRGPGIWKFNNSLLDDESFCVYMNDCITDLISCRNHFPSPKIWWDFVKESMKSDIISFAKKKRKQLNHERVSLTNELIELKKQLANGNLSLSAEIISIESRLSALNDRAMDGVKIRSRAQWFEEGEKPSRYFFKLEKERMEKNYVKSIFNSDGVEVFSREEIESAHVDFYSKLFSSEPIDPESQSILFNEVQKFLSDVDSDVCEGSISLSELSASVKSLNLCKAPGSDGFTVEFYRKFWNLLGPHLVNVINACFTDGELCESMKSSVTRLIYKKRGDIKDLKNWRPISLLNVDYKICSKAITLRLSKVLDSIIDPDQTCSVPGRSISSNIVLLRDTLNYIEQTDETGILVSLDQEKAFDRVDRGFLLDLLRHFGFGPDFCHWIHTFYSGANMQIILNGFLTKQIPLLRGVRQGDSLSPLLYILCVEVLACQIRNSPDIRGFLLPGAGGKQFKVRQYADDTTSFVKDYNSLVNLFKLISLYEKGSGAKLNRSKTEAMWLGAWRNRTDEPLGLTWVRKMKIVGVFFGTVPVEQDNWQTKINKLDKSINLWKSRSLSLVGKSLIINILGLSKLLYLAKVLIPPKWVFTRLNQIIWPFLWNSKMETVSRNTCYLPDLSGGLNVSNFESKCNALRITSVVSTFSLLEDTSFFLCKYFLGSRISTMKPEWNLLRDNSSPSALTLTKYYDACLTDLNKISSLIKSNVALTTKNIYAHLLKVRSSPPLLSPFWSSYLGPGFGLKDHWTKVRDSFTENFKNDVLWLIILRGIKVRDSLKKWGYINSDRCAFCNRKESIDHCFVNCQRVKKVWEHFSPTLSALLGNVFTANVLTVFFFRWPSNIRKTNRIAHFMIKTILYAIWKFRNKTTFHNGTEDHRAIIKYATHDIKSRIRLDHYRLSESAFLEIWGIPCICSLHNDTLIFNDF